MRTNYVLFFAQNQILQLVWFGNIPVTFKEKIRFFWDPLFVPFLLNLSFEDPQKSSMIFYRKDLTAKIMSRTHMLFLKLPKSPDRRTDRQTSIFRRFPHNSPKGAITLTRRQWMLNVSSAKSKASSHCARTKFARTSDMSRVAKRSAGVR